MNYVVHFYYYPDYVVYCKTLDEVKQVIKVKETDRYLVYITTENVESGAETATWAWEKMLEQDGHTRKLVEL